MKGPRAFERHDLRLLDGTEGDAREVDPTTVVWNALDKGRFPCAWHPSMDKSAEPSGAAPAIADFGVRDARSQRGR